MTRKRITTTQKLQCAERALRHLQNYYRTQIELGHRIDGAADLALLQSIVDDYKARLEQEMTTGDR